MSNIHQYRRHPRGSSPSHGLGSNPGASKWDKEQQLHDEILGQALVPHSRSGRTAPRSTVANHDSMVGGRGLTADPWQDDGGEGG
jgi:hypothetical protein